MSGGVRVKLCVCGVFNEREEHLGKLWIYVNKSVTRSIEDLGRRIREKLAIPKLCQVSLELDGYLIPPDEHIDILRDNDEIRVIKDCSTHEHCANNHGNVSNTDCTKCNSMNVGEPLNQPSCIVSECPEKLTEKEILPTSNDDTPTLNGYLNQSEVISHEFEEGIVRLETSNGGVEDTRRKRKRKRPSKQNLTSFMVVDDPTLTEIESKTQATQIITEKIKCDQISTDLPLTSSFKMLNESQYEAVQKNAPGKVKTLGKVKVFKRNVISDDAVSLRRDSSFKLSCPPDIGSIIKFKMLELSADYNPIISDFKKAEILQYCPVSQRIQLRLYENSCVTKPDGRFELTIEDKEQILTNKIPIDNEVSMTWTELIEPSLVGHSSQ